MTTTQTDRPQTSLATRADLSTGSAVTTGRSETATAMMAAKAQAEMQARYIVAMQRPRDEELFRTKIIAACERKRFAEQAIYAKPVGRQKNPVTGKWEDKLVEGLSVRFAEQALQYFGNLYQSTHTLVDDDDKRILHCSVIDLETNAAVGQDIVIEKFVERKKPREGDEIVGARENSYGETVYRIRANEDALLTKVNNLQAKLRRGLILQLIPADVKDEAIEIARKTASAEGESADPVAEKRKILDGFFRLGITSPDLVDYLGKKLEQLLPADIDHLRRVFVAIRDGEASWSDFATQAEAEAAEGSGDRSADLAKKVSAQTQRQAPARRGGGAKKSTKTDKTDGGKPGGQGALDV